MHSKSIFHNDLKLQNILKLVKSSALGKLEIFLISDFGVSKIFNGITTKNTYKSLLGISDEYAAPELLKYS